MLVAEIARASGIMSSKTLTQVNNLISVLAKEYTKSPDLITSGCWADDLKSSSVAHEAAWHFINLPIIDKSYDGPSPVLYSKDNAVWAIDQSTSTTRAKTAQVLDKARHVRFLVHIVGDIHQPLHAVQLWSKRFPKGDYGGNSFNISGVAHAKNLHALWDAGGDLWHKDLKRPLDSAGSQWIKDMASSMMKTHPKSSMSSLYTIRSADKWSKEALQLAKDVVYKAPSHSPITAAYMKQVREHSIRQVTLAGYRLAYLFEYIFGNTSSENEEPFDMGILAEEQREHDASEYPNQFRTWAKETWEPKDLSLDEDEEQIIEELKMRIFELQKRKNLRAFKQKFQN